MRAIAPDIPDAELAADLRESEIDASRCRFALLMGVEESQFESVVDRIQTNLDIAAAIRAEQKRRK